MKRVIMFACLFLGQVLWGGSVSASRTINITSAAAGVPVIHNVTVTPNPITFPISIMVEVSAPGATTASPSSVAVTAVMGNGVANRTYTVVCDENHQGVIFRFNSLTELPAGTYNAQFYATNTTGTSPNYNTTIVVPGPANTAPVVTLANPIINGTSATFSWSGTDANGDAITYSYSLDAGAWSNYAAGTSVTYNNLAVGNHTFQVKCRDAQNLDGNSATATITIATPNVAPVFTSITSPATGTTNQNFTMVVKGRNPDGLQLTFGVSISNGTNLTSQTLTGTANNDELTATFTGNIATAGTYTITYSLNDGQGSTITDTRTIVVTAPANVAPIIDDFNVPSTAVQNTTVTMSISFHDVDSGVLYGSINFGDNSQPFTFTKTGNVNTPFTVSFSHTFSVANTFQVVATIADTSGNTTQMLISNENQIVGGDK